MSNAACGAEQPGSHASQTTMRICRILSALILASLVAMAFADTGIAAPVRVVVSGAPAGRMETQLSTNDVYAGMLAEAPLAQRNFAALGMPLVRVHAGNDGTDPPALPEVHEGKWSLVSLDRLVNDQTRLGREPVMNIKFAPDWMWTCTSPQAPGRIRDATFAQYGEYMARLVSYYNRGAMRTESGDEVINPAGTSNHISWWEPWNEPDLANETPCAPPSGQALTPREYVTMWNAVTSRMLAVDPSLRFVGPSTAGGQFGSNADAGSDYLTLLDTEAAVKPAAIAFHGYGYWDNDVSDRTMFSGDASGAGGIDDIVDAARAVHLSHAGIPIWITEINVNAAWGADSAARPSGALGVAWWGSAFARLAPAGVALLHQYDFVDGPQFGLVAENGQRRLTWWAVRMLDNVFAPGGVRLLARSGGQGVDVLAARSSDRSVAVLVVNRRVASAASRSGTGSPVSVGVSLPGRPRLVRVQQLDATSRALSGPRWRGTSAHPVISFRGYGLAIVRATY